MDRTLILGGMCVCACVCVCVCVRACVCVCVLMFANTFPVLPDVKKREKKQEIFASYRARNTQNHAIYVPSTTTVV